MKSGWTNCRKGFPSPRLYKRNRLDAIPCSRWHHCRCRGDSYLHPQYLHTVFGPCHFGGQRLYVTGSLCHGQYYGESRAFRKSFSSMILGFGCTVPAIMATRALETEHDRRKTMIVTPFMSCSARLPIYVLFSDMFFGKYAAIVAFFYVCNRDGHRHSGSKKLSIKWKREKKTIPF